MRDFVLVLAPGQGRCNNPRFYSLLLLTVHLPVVIIRAMKWEGTQWWSLTLAAFSIGLTTFAYVSTHMAPEEVFVWTPIALIVDVGAMMQIFILIVEGDGEDIQSWTREVDQFPSFHHGTPVHY